MINRGPSAPVRITVLLPVYNGAAYLDAALDSILDQTCVDFELVVIDDGSTDDSAARVRARTDARIRLLQQPGNLGLVAALNRGLEEARGEYIARMDADDISFPRRFEKQLLFLDAHPEVGVCGTWMEAFSANSTVIWPAPTEHDEIHCNLLFESVLYHPTVMLRREMVERFGLRYDSDYSHAEDFELWSRFASLCKMANLREVLLRYRIHGESVGGCKRQEKLATASRVRNRLLRQLGLSPSYDEMKIHDALALLTPPGDRVSLASTHSWLLKLQEANQARKIYAVTEFKTMLARRWYQACLGSTALGMDAYRAWGNSPFKASYCVPWPHRLLFLGRSLARN